MKDVDDTREGERKVSMSVAEQYSADSLPNAANEMILGSHSLF